MKKKNIIVITVIILITIIIVIISFRQSPGKNIEAKPAPAPNQPRLISTNPNPLDDTIIAADQTVEITFSHPLENVPEFKIKIEPKLDYKIELSGDKKTVKIIPVASFELGTTYTLFITTDSKFEGGGRLPKELNFHFRTVKYRGF